MGSQGRTGKAEDAKSAGRRNYPEAVPKERSGGNGKIRTNSIYSANSNQWLKFPTDAARRSQSKRGALVP
jgi:hypothetical protein